MFLRSIFSSSTKVKQLNAVLEVCHSFDLNEISALSVHYISPSRFRIRKLRDASHSVFCLIFSVPVLTVKNYMLWMINIQPEPESPRLLEESGGARPFPCPWSTRPAAARPIPSPSRTKPGGTQTPRPGPRAGAAGNRSVDFMGYQCQRLFCTVGARPALGRPGSAKEADGARRSPTPPAGLWRCPSGRRHAGKREARLRSPGARGESRGGDGPLAAGPPNSQSGERRARPERAGADPVFPRQAAAAARAHPAACVPSGRLFCFLSR